MELRVFNKDEWATMKGYEKSDIELVMIGLGEINRLVTKEKKILKFRKHAVIVKHTNGTYHYDPEDLIN